MTDIRFVSIPQAAALVGLPYQTLLAAFRRGELHAIYPNPQGRPRIGLDELARWCEWIGIEEPLASTEASVACGSEGSAR